MAASRRASGTRPAKVSSARSFSGEDGSSSATSWNELDFEKINSNCRLQTNIWTGKAVQNATTNTPDVQYL